MPTGPEWKHTTIKVDGGMDENGQPETEECDLWWRDPEECVRELIGNPTLKEHIRYAPEHVFEDEKRERRRYDEMWTGTWWWETQVNYNTSSCFTDSEIS